MSSGQHTSSWSACSEVGLRAVITLISLMNKEQITQIQASPEITILFMFRYIVVEWMSVTT